MCYRLGGAATPPNVCEQILCYDMETFFVGGSVCKAWHSVISQEGCSPVNMEFGCKSDTLLVPSESGFISRVLQNHSKKTEDLCLCANLVGEAEQYLPLLSHCHALGRLALRLPPLTNWHALDNVATSLQYLEVAILHMDASDWEPIGAEGPMFEYSLVVFNQFHKLEVLELQFLQLQYVGKGYRECSLLPILGDLHLPCLTSLDLGTECGSPEDGYNDETLVAPDLTFIGVPETCCIQCNLILPQSAASQRLGRDI